MIALTELTFSPVHITGFIPSFFSRSFLPVLPNIPQGAAQSTFYSFFFKYGFIGLLQRCMSLYIIKKYKNTYETHFTNVV